MIGEFLINIVFTIIQGLFSALPDFSWTFDFSTAEAFLDIIHLITYFFPMPVVYFIVLFYIWKTEFRLKIAIAKTIWDILPLV